MFPVAAENCRRRAGSQARLEQVLRAKKKRSKASSKRKEGMVDPLLALVGGYSTPSRNRGAMSDWDPMQDVWLKKHGQAYVRTNPPFVCTSRTLLSYHCEIDDLNTRGGYSRVVMRMN